MKVEKIAVISDPQIDLREGGDGAENKESKILRECFRHMNVDVVALCGDITENALPEEWNCFFDTFKQYCKAKELFLVPGNMDGVYKPKERKAFYDAYERYCGKKIENHYFTHESDQCILIGISPEQAGNDTLSDSQLTVLDESIKKAAERGIPAFVFSHYGLFGTIHIDWEYATLGDESGKVKAIFKKYGGKVIFFSGHIHRGLITELGGSLITLKNVTYVSTPSICKPDTEHYSADNDSVGTGYMVEIGDDCVRIRGYDFLHQEWLSAFDWTV